MRIDGKANDRAPAFVRACCVGLGAAVIAAGALYSARAQALNVCIRVAPYTETMPDGTSTAMWGYQVAPSCTPADLADPLSAINQPVSSPGDAITVPANDTTLTVTLINQLTVPTSFVLHGHNTAMTPKFTRVSDGADCTPTQPPIPAGATAPTMAALQAFRDCRVRSFTTEAAPGGTAVYTYNVKPGSYLYQSGTMPQIQVQMGLYGLVRKNAAPTATAAQVAYADAVVPDKYAYDSQLALVLSEVDPIVHNDVKAGTFNRSTLAYDPKYFRVHRYDPPGAACATLTPDTCIGQPLGITDSPAGTPLPIQPGQRQLVRVVNAGIQSRALTLIDGHWYAIAEDGNRFPYPREQYSAFLPAAKTSDLWFTPTLAAGATSRPLAIFDRRLALTNNNADADGGLMVRLDVSAAGSALALNVAACPVTGMQGAPYACTVTTTGSTTPSYAFDVAPVGMTISSGGVIAWTPTNAQAQRPAAPTLTNPVLVRATDPATGRYATAGFSVAVANVNDAPVAVNDAYDVRGGSLVATTSVLANDSEPDGDAFGAVAVVTGLAGLTMNANGTFNYSTASLPASGSQARTFTYRVPDSAAALSNVATVTLNVFANAAPTVVDDIVTRARFTPLESPTLIDVLFNDFDVDGNLAASTLTIVGAPNRGGTATVVPACIPNPPNPARPCIRYTPPRVNFRGTDAITYTVSDTLGAVSALGTARVNVE